MAKKLVLLTFAGIMLSACSVLIHGVMLNSHDNGRELTLYPGQTVTLSLPSNPTTGYEWHISHMPSQLLAQVGSSVYQPHQPQAIGSGGKQVFTFTVLQKGHGELHLNYERAWEKSVTKNKNGLFVIKLQVK